MAVLASLSLTRLPPVPADPSNAVERLPAAVDLGKRLFNDARFSANGAVSCATCHDAQKQFQDGLPVGRGVGTGSRRAMPIVGAGHSNWLFWDGRKDSLWAQALGPLEDAVEHATNRTRVAHLLAANYRSDYEGSSRRCRSSTACRATPGPTAARPSRRPGPPWTLAGAKTSRACSRTWARPSRRTRSRCTHEPTRLDRYVDAVVRRDPAAREVLQANEVRGLRLFIGKAQCVSCHNGPLFTDQQFHNTGVPPRDAARPDRGRAAATAKVRGDEFNCLGPFSDAQPKQCQELRFMVSDDPALEGAFKTPGLRGVAQRPPYMHAGQFTTLEQVVRHYVAAPHAVVGHSELKHRHASATDGTHAERAPIELTDAEVADLVSFLGTLSTDRQSASAAP